MRKFFGWTMLLAMALSTVALCGSVAQASVTGDTISIAFARDEPPNTAGCALAPADLAGAPGYSSVHWINETLDIGNDSNLTRDTAGVASTTSAQLTWTSDNTWSNDGTRGEFNNAFPGADGNLMNGYLDCGNGANGGLTEIQVTNLPADMAAGYSLVVYTLGGVRGRPSMFTANGNGPLYAFPGGPGGATTYYQHAMVGTYVQIIGDDPAGNGADDYGNYLVFTGLSGDLDLLALPNGGGTPRAAVHAIQIVKNP